jgi:purine nucleosidase/pyrimidine-specific ribonucleoside hydrolase
LPRPILIDTDTGVDDALALIVALRSPEVSVKAITTVAGNVEVEKCTRNVFRILRLLQLGETPIVAQGAKKPLHRPLFSAPEVHGHDGLGNFLMRLPPTAKKNPRGAVDVIIESCRRYAGRLTIVAIGPLTNLARAWKKDRTALRQVGRIVSMGGAFHVPGNTGPVAEFNYFVDPEAAHILLQSGLPITVVPLDVTQQLVLMRKEVEYRAKRRASALASAILLFTRPYMRYHKKAEGFDGAYLHDPIAVAAAIDRRLIQTRGVHVDVETSGSYTRGMTVADFRARVPFKPKAYLRPRRMSLWLKPPAEKKPSVDIAVKIDRERFLKLFHERLWM